MTARSRPEAGPTVFHEPATSNTVSVPVGYPPAISFRSVPDEPSSSTAARLAIDGLCPTTSRVRTFSGASVTMSSRSSTVLA